MMSIEEAFIVGESTALFRHGQAARVVGLVIGTPAPSTSGQTYPPRPCFEVEFDDGVRDFWPLSDMPSYRFVTRTEAMRMIEAEERRRDMTDIQARRTGCNRPLG